MCTWKTHIHKRRDILPLKIFFFVRWLVSVDQSEVRRCHHELSILMGVAFSVVRSFESFFFFFFFSFQPAFDERSRSSLYLL